MKAIVQSCDRYHSMAQNMLVQYEKLWPSNPFTFRVPWNEKYPEVIENQFGSKIELINAGIKFKQTFHALTKDLDDNDWVYWCIDDRYLISIEEGEANQVLNFVESIKNPNIINVCFHFVRYIKDSANCIQREGSGVEIYFENLRFIQHKSFINNWLHQFFRVKALREFWRHIEEPPQYQAIQMDYSTKPLNGISLTLDHNISRYGESTEGGTITKNCQNSCIENNISIPKIFLSKKQKTIII